MCHQVFNGLTHLVSLKSCFAQLLLQLLYQFSVFLHTLGDKLDIFLNLGSFVCALARLGNGDALFSSVDFCETLLNIIQRSHHVVNLTIPLGYDALQRMNDEIAKFMDTHGYETLEDMRGIALPLIGDYDSVLHKPACVASFDSKTCIACGKCIKTCFYDAISKVDGVMRADPSKCDGCGLCTQLCPLGAVKLTEK